MRRRLIDFTLLAAEIVVGLVIVVSDLIGPPTPSVSSPVPQVLRDDLDADMERRLREGELLTQAWRGVAS